MGKSIQGTQKLSGYHMKWEPRMNSIVSHFANIGIIILPASLLW